MPKPTAPPLRYEDNHPKEVPSGLPAVVCGNCGKGFVLRETGGAHARDRKELEDIARKCCGGRDRPCDVKDCNGRANNGYVRCKECMVKDELTRYLSMPSKPLSEVPEGAPLYSDANSNYYPSLEEAEYAAEEMAFVRAGALPDDVEPSLEAKEEALRDLRLIICVPSTPRKFDLDKWLEDVLPDSNDNHFDSVEDFASAEEVARVEAAVNDFTAAHTWSWEPGKCRLDLDLRGTS